MKKLFIFSVILFWTASALAAPVYNSSNLHWYEAIAGEFDWSEARDAAESLPWIDGVQGHLATLTSAGEDTWVWGNLGVDLYRYYLGGFQDPDFDEPNLASYADGWQWVTGETWAYTNWTSGKPNNLNNGVLGTDEDALAYWSTGEWNDLPDTKDIFGPGGTRYIQGYVAEFDTPEPISSILFVIGGISLATVGYRKRRKARA